MSCKKIIFVRYLDFQLKNVQIPYLVNFATIWGIKINKHSLVFYSFIVLWSWTVSLINIIKSNILRLKATILKCPDFHLEISGILNAKIQTYYNSVIFFKKVDQVYLLKQKFSIKLFELWKLAFVFCVSVPKLCLW